MRTVLYSAVEFRLMNWPTSGIHTDFSGSEICAYFRISGSEICAYFRISGSEICAYFRISGSEICAYFRVSGSEICAYFVIPNFLFKHYSYNIRYHIPLKVRSIRHQVTFNLRPFHNGKMYKMIHFLMKRILG
jgi:hypothetical protein